MYSHVLLLSMYLLGFAMGTMFANFHVCDIMVLLREVVNILVRNTSPRGPMSFMCLCLISQDLVSCYIYFVLLPLGLELW